MGLLSFQHKELTINLETTRPTVEVFKYHNKLGRQLQVIFEGGALVFSDLTVEQSKELEQVLKRSWYCSPQEFQKSNPTP